MLKTGKLDSRLLEKIILKNIYFKRDSEVCGKVFLFLIVIGFFSYGRNLKSAVKLWQLTA